jgi:hypothetical protein
MFKVAVEFIGQSVVLLVVLNVIYFTVKAIAVVVYSATVYCRAVRIARVLREREQSAEARNFVAVHHFTVNMAFFWMAPAPYVTIPTYEVLFRRRCRRLLFGPSASRPA